MLQTVKKRIISNPNSMLLSKLRNFFRRSIFKYLIASVLIAIGIPALFGGVIWTSVGVFVILCLLSFIVMYAGSKIQAKKINLDAEITFGETEIIVAHRNKEVTERKNWNWIIRSEENDFGFFLRIQKDPVHELIFQKTNLTEDEINTMRSWLSKNIQDSKK